MKIHIHVTNRLVAEALQLLLADEKIDGTRVAVSFGQTAHPRRPDVILVDHLTIGARGMDQRKTARILLLDLGLRQEEVISILLRHRLHGILPVSTDPALFRKALSVVCQGQLWISNPTLKALLAKPELILREKQGDGRLTERERSIVEQICRGHRNREVAKKLGVSEQTVKAHLSRILRS